MDTTTNAATLIAHNPRFKCSIVTREELRRFAPPMGTSSWRPVAHAELVEVLHERLTSIGLPVLRDSYAVSENGLSLFGTMELGDVASRGRAMALGFRHGNDKRMVVDVRAGSRVFVCDNLALSGDRVVLRKHTSGINLANVIREGLDRYLVAAAAWEASVVEAEHRVLSDDEAKVRLFDLRYSGAIPVSIFDESASNYFRAETLGYEDSAPRTVWGLHNACTRAVKRLAPGSQFSSLTALGRAFGLGTASSN